MLESKDWSSLLKALGKLNYVSTPDVHDRILQGIDHSRGSATLTDLINICWGLLRVQISERNSLQSGNRGNIILSQFFRDNRVFEVYQQLESVIRSDLSSVRRLRPFDCIPLVMCRSQLCNLVYLLSYSRFPDRFLL